jgi:AcrR family transcriptional regulator
MFADCLGPKAFVRQPTGTVPMTPGPAGATLPLRERKKLTTRRALIHHSHRLFLERGYRATTLDAIADAAEVTVQTLLRYFPTKEDLALALEYRTLERLKQRLAERPLTQDVFDVWTQFMIDVVDTWAEDPALIDYQILCQNDPTLLAHALRVIDANEDLLVHALSEQLRVNPDIDLRPRMAAALAVHAGKQLSRVWVLDPNPESMRTGIKTLAESARAVLSRPTT